MKSTVSIIVPAYNEVNYLDKCIMSIQSQTYKAMICEILVIDNMSIDGTRELAGSSGATVIVNNKHGAAASRNLGAHYAKGEALAFVDADCVLDPEWLEKLTGCYERSGVSAVAARAMPVNDDMTWVEAGWSEVFVGKRGGGYTRGDQRIKSWLIKSSCEEATFSKSRWFR